MNLKLESLSEPSFVNKDSSNICLTDLNDGNLIIGHEFGCYFTNINSNVSTQTEFEYFRDKEVVSVSSKDRGEEASNEIYIACEKSIYFYDTRISFNTHQHSFAKNIDEINQIKINNCEQLAACDDSGEIQIYDLKTNATFRSLRRKHTNICSSVSFINGRNDEIISGGLDSKVNVWDFKRVKVLQTVNTQDLLAKIGDNSVYMFNPPLIYSLDSSQDGRLAACGLANGFLQLFNVTKRKKMMIPNLLINHHSSVGVSALLFLNDIHANILVSGGNDNMVHLWNIPTDLPVGNELPNLCTDEEVQNLLLSSFNVQSKVNFIGNGIFSNKQFVFIADQTPCMKYIKMSS